MSCSAPSSFHLVVIGGTALQALGFVQRATRDVDVLGLLTDDTVRPTLDIPPALASARDRVASDFGLSPDWLNVKPAHLTDLGLPEGFANRLVARKYGPALTVHFAGREDFIHFKLYAMVDQGGGRHETDLRALNPSPTELISAAKWARTHDPSEPFAQQLRQALAILGVPDAEANG